MHNICLNVPKSCRLTFFGHFARMDENADASQAIFEPTPENWRQPPGRPHTTLRTFTMTCLCWILGYMRLEIWRKIGLSADWCLCTVLRTRSGACYYWIVCIKLTATMLHHVTYHTPRRTPSTARTAHRAVMADTMQHGTAHASHQTAFRGDPEQAWSPGPHTRTACLFISTGNTRQPY